MSDSATPSVQPCASSARNAACSIVSSSTPKTSVAEDLAQLIASSGSISASRLGRGRGLGGEPHDEPFDAAGEERDRGIGLRVDPVGDHLGQPGLRLTPRLERPADDHRRLTRAREQVGEHVLRHHQLHLVRHARHRVDDLAVDLRPDAGRGPDRVRDHVGAGRDVGLAQVVHRHVAQRGRRRASRCARRAPRVARARRPSPRRSPRASRRPGSVRSHRTRRPRPPSPASRDIAATIRGRLSPDLAVLHRVDARPRRAARRSSDEFVSTIWPSSSSVPIARTSTRTRHSGSPAGSRGGRCRRPRRS